MLKTKIIRGISEIVDFYEIYFIDLWGVIHNGVKLFPGVNDVLKVLKKKKKTVFFITNAPRRSYVIADQLNDFGLSKKFYNNIISSGEITWLSLKKNFEKKKCFMIGPPRDFHLIEGLDIEVVEDYSKGG